jgi:hypothetical protein
VLLRQQIAQTFSESELKTICFDLGIDFEELGQGNKTDKIIELIGLMRRRGWLGNLLSAINDARPSLEWPTLEILLADEVVTLDLGQTLNQIYEQDQQQAKTKPPNKPILANERWSAFEFEDAAANYKHHLNEHYGFLHILGHNRPVPLEGVFTDVYLYDRPLAHRRLDLKALEEQFRQRQVEQYGVKRVDGLALVKTQSRLFILGQPGAGKTTFLKHVALQTAKGDLPGIPIFISLKALADSQKPLLVFMAQEMQICGFPEPLPFLQLMLRSGQMLILLDGLDEVTQAQETALNLIQDIENLIRQYSANHFLITCRTAVTDYQFPGFTTVEMSNFSPEQVDTFIHKWFQHEPSLGDKCLEELNLSEHSGLLDLATTPLLLNMLCLTYEEVGHFPQRRVELYEEALNALLVKWDNSRRIKRDETYQHLSLGRKRQLFNHIAYTTFQQGQYFIPKATIARHILDFLKPVPEIGELHEDDGEAILRAIEAQHGIIVERARGVYGFAHLTFQEYFTAKYIDAVGEKSWSALFSHRTESQWREVFLLTTSLLQEADDFFQRFIIEIDRQLPQDIQLLPFFSWVTQTANDRLEALQFLITILSRELGRARTDALNLANARDHTLGLALGYTLDHALAVDPGYGIVHTFNRTPTGAQAHVFDFGGTPVFDLTSANTSALDLARSSDRDPLITLDFALIYSWLYSRYSLAHPFIRLAQEISRTQRLTSLPATLDKLVIPGENVPEHEHQQLAETIWQIVQQERQLQLFELTLEQMNTLDNYLKSKVLLLQCLKLAVVTDRDAILSRLLTPPPS